MTDKEFKHLNRAELIEVIYQLQKNEKLLLQEMEDLKSQLEDKRYHISKKISEAGSIAEAVVGLSGIFETAQAAADVYLAELHEANADMEARCNQTIEDAKLQAASILKKAEEESKMLHLRAEQESAALRQSAEAESAAMRTEAERAVAQKWSDFKAKTDELLHAHAELSALLNR